MKIKSVNIPVKPNADGLKPICMSRLQSIVLLAGKNGSGKTRILNAIREAASLTPTKSAFERSRSELDDISARISKEREILQSKSVRLKTRQESEARLRLIQEIDLHKANVKILSDQIQSHTAVINWSLLDFGEHFDQYPIISFVPKSTSLSDPRNFGTVEMHQRAAAVKLAGVEHLPGGALSKIQTAQDQWFDATHPESQTATNEKELAVSDYSRLQSYVFQFLGTRLGRNSRSLATIFHEPLADARLSEGQTILLQFCVALFSQSSSLLDSIVFLDEPENHLHPAALLEFIEELRSKLPEGQIWIATHSIPLLAYFDPSCIWCVQDGQVSFAGNTPAVVLDALLGGDERRAQLRDFMDLPAVHALYRHAFESLFVPQPVTTASNDPQTSQIRAEFKRLKKEGEPLRILDYGAGRGRLAANIADYADERDAITYYAYDPNRDHRDECIANMARIQPNAEKRYFNDLQTLLTYEDAGSFDVVVLANVLHEIDPSKWLSIFGDGGDISKLLQADGSVLIVEDHLMPIGEKAYQKGFIVLNTPELKELFGVPASAGGFVIQDSRGDGRLKSHAISKRLLVQITAQRRVNALASANRVAQARIIELRTAELSYINGKRHAFWVQQLANTQLCLSDLGYPGA